ncbi:non-ribosomal peptide synthetase [Micromonospora sp. NBC_01813]|uniref:non-ribosomal peptide synthetase n=1 Tax=Micromonospora sp. NBC_01813 TaxID=2975988 RepID=UPI002DD94068|nr:amino acid adenylation domain-containing protein [Micromonospora sp. NBC_01813]WSA10768.1 amino acid adenylation domain-containing protein [Micromonospora sp. NBC_01813]
MVDLSPTAAPTSTTFPLTDLQSAYLVGASDMIELGGIRPSMYLEFDLVAADPDRAIGALATLIRRHEHLRTEILPDGTHRILTAEEVVPPPVDVMDLTRHAPDERRVLLAESRVRLTADGVEPTGWPLFRISAFLIRRHRMTVQIAMSLLLLDARSTRLLQREWQALCRDPSTVLPPAGTFRELLGIVLGRRTGPDYDRQVRYWHDRLGTLPGPPQLPLARPTGDLTGVRMRRREVLLSAAHWRTLTAAARAHRLLPATAMLHVFAETLSAWAALPRFSVAVLHQNWANGLLGLETTIGQFGATLPLVVESDHEEDFWARAARLQRQLWSDMANAQVSGVQIARDLAAREGWSTRAALPYVFNSMLATSRTTRSIGRPACRSTTTEVHTPQVLIDNQLVDNPDGGIICVWDSVDDAYPDGLVDLMFDAYRRMLDELTGPVASSATPSAIPPDHRERISVDNDTQPAVPVRLEAVFLAQAAVRPRSPAVITPDLVLDYAELERRSRSVAAWLRWVGAGPGTVVPVVAAKGWEQVVAVLGVLRAGGAYCPVDASLPEDRRTALIDTCGSPAVLATTRSLPDGHRELPVLRLDGVVPDEGGSVPVPAPVGSVTDLAYVIHTSGSTGTPKGVMIEHGAAWNTIREVAGRIGLGPEDRVFGVSSLSFDLSVWDVFATLSAGAALVLPAATTHPDPAGWVTMTYESGVTVWNSVPALAELFTEACGSSRVPPVRAFLLSGDWVPTELPDRLRGRWPAAQVIAMGGATEASIWSNWYEADDVDPTWRSVPYGRPLRGQTMRVLNQRREICPPWTTGEIWIGGAGVARGYWRDPVRTAEVFVAHPRTGERQYRTGDLGRYRPDGTIEFLGRRDRQVKVDGFRVEPAEVEAALSRHPGVRGCAVGTVASATSGQRLVALVVPADPEPTADALILHLRALLPHYLVPSRVAIVEQFALNTNGKVDIAASLACLDPPDGDSADVRAETSGPLTPVVEQVAALCAQLLETDVVGADDNLFSLGANSLLVLRLTQRIRQRFAVDIPFGQVFQSPTARALAEAVNDERSATRTDGPLRLSDGTGTALVLFHPVGGSVAAYTALAAAWPGPVYAFQSPALAGSGPDRPVDFEDLTRTYAAQLPQEEPVLLGGWSMGGVLAHEVARVLAAAGVRCGVVMIDSDAAERRLPAHPGQWHLEFLTDLARGHPPQGIVQLRDTDEHTAEADAHRIAVGAGLVPSGTSREAYRRLSSVHAANLSALAGYDPRPTSAPTLLLIADAVPRRHDPVEAWAQRCPDLRVHRMPYDHFQIVHPDHAHLLIDAINDWWSAVAAKQKTHFVEGESDV